MHTCILILLSYFMFLQCGQSTHSILTNYFDLYVPVSVKTEVHPAGDSPVTSGRSFGRGSSGKNSEYPVLTGPPVSTRAPAINRSFGQM